LAAGDLPYEKLEPLSRRVGEIIQLLDEKGLRWLELSEMS
jgi:ATP-binding cassette subfamily F protein uup